MAELLKREYDLVVLKTELRQDFGRGEPNVRFTLQAKQKGILTDLRSWQMSPSELGLPSRERDASSRERPASSRNENIPFEVSQLRLPQPLLDELQLFFQQLEEQRPLWVHLVKPYGALRYLPWERLLGEALQVPVLMLPDFIFPRPRESAAAFEVALCASAPLGHEDYWVMHAIRVSIFRILASATRPIRLHVFVDAERATEVRDLGGVIEPGREVVVHQNADAAKYCDEDLSSRMVDKLGILRSPWLLWMRDVFRSRSVDVVHFICHGYLSRDHGAMLFAQSPLTRTARYLSGPVSDAELQTFLTQVGAWSTVFTSLPDNNSELGLRALADDIAQSRPGPLMMHTLNAQTDGHELEEGYRFLYSLAPVPVPRSSHLFMYCQPYLAAPRVLAPAREVAFRGAATGGRPFPAPTIPPGSIDISSDLARNDLQRQFVSESQGASALDSMFEHQENVAPWVASTERFAEQVQLRYQRLARDELISKDVADQRMKLAMDTIGKLRSAVASNFAPVPPEKLK